MYVILAGGYWIEFYFFIDLKMTLWFDLIGKDGIGGYKRTNDPLGFLNNRQDRRHGAVLLVAIGFN
jgi:hypothetical protein